MTTASPEELSYGDRDSRIASPLMHLSIMEPEDPRSLIKAYWAGA